MNTIDDLKKVLSRFKVGDDIEIEGTYPGGRYIYIFKVEILDGNK